MTPMWASLWNHAKTSASIGRETMTFGGVYPAKRLTPGVEIAGRAIAGHAIALGDRCASSAAMNRKAAIVSVFILGEFEHVSAHRRLSAYVAEAAGPTDVHRNPRLAFMQRAYLETEFSPPLPPTWSR